MLLAPNRAVRGIPDSSIGERFELRFFGLKKVRRVRKFYFTTLHNGLEWCIRHQPKDWRPNYPAPRTSADKIFLEVERAIRTKGGRLCLFCAIGSELDLWRGIDGFFTWDNGKGAARVVTFDLTCGHKNKIRADVLIHEQDFDSSIRFNDLAKRIAKKLKRPSAVHYFPSLAEIK